MKNFEIDNIKKFTSALFAGDAFDSFCVTEASFCTLVNISIDGHINKAFLDDEEEQNADEAICWIKLKPLCYEIIKGRRVPLRFKVVLMLPKEKIAEVIHSEVLNIDASNINGLFLNINFEEGRLHCTTGTSMKTFLLERTIDEAWDSYVGRFIAGLEV